MPLEGEVGVKIEGRKHRKSDKVKLTEIHHRVKCTKDAVGRSGPVCI